MAIIAGKDSKTKKLGFRSTSSFFLDSKTLKIMLKFVNSVDLSLHTDEEKLAVTLWGPFFSVADF